MWKIMLEEEGRSERKGGTGYWRGQRRGGEKENERKDRERKGGERSKKGGRGERRGKGVRK